MSDLSPGLVAQVDQAKAGAAEGLDNLVVQYQSCLDAIGDDQDKVFPSFLAFLMRTYEQWDPAEQALVMTMATLVEAVARLHDHDCSSRCELDHCEEDHIGEDGHV